MIRKGQIEAIKARVFEGRDGRTYADLDGMLFNGWEATAKEISDLIEILEQVKDEINRGV